MVIPCTCVCYHHLKQPQRNENQLRSCDKSQMTSNNLVMIPSVSPPYPTKMGTERQVAPGSPPAKSSNVTLLLNKNNKKLIIKTYLTNIAGKPSIAKRTSMMLPYLHSHTNQPHHMSLIQLIQHRCMTINLKKTR